MIQARHSAVVRVTHWVTALCFLALLVSGAGILISHPRFYWGETGTVRTRAWLTIPIPASRPAVPTGYGYMLPDENGWGRYLHFQSAWAVVLTGLLYLAAGVGSGHLRRNLVAGRAVKGGAGYNPLQRLTYLAVVFGLFPLAIWTGLAMSPAIGAAAPGVVTALGGRQSARTIHFFVAVLLLGFVLVHVAMVWRAGFRSRMRGMITGRGREMEEA